MITHTPREQYQCRRRHNRLLSALVAAMAGVAGVGYPLINPPMVQSAERIEIRVTGPLILNLSVESLATFAETGEITREFRPYAQLLGDEALDDLQRLLRVSFPLDVTTTSHLSYSPLGRDVLTNLGKVIQFLPGENGLVGLRAAVINAAAQAGPDGWTLIDAMRAFPTESIDISLRGLLDLQRELSVYLSDNRAFVKAIQAQAEAEIAGQSELGLSQLPDLSQPGPYAVSRQTITVTNPALRQTTRGLTVNYDFDVDVYLPEGITTPAPVVVVSHGFGAVKEDFIFLNQHLASYGYAIMAPDHVGSDLQFRQAFLGGRLNTLLSPIEFVNRPREISFLIDQLERLVADSPTWDSQLDLDRIAVIGDSLGSSTVMALAGAELSQPRIADQCDQDQLILNFSLYIQCSARFLPPTTFDLTDDRIKAAIAAHNLGTALYSPESLAEISIPLLMVSGSADIVAPVVVEQILPFRAMQQPSRYLSLLHVGTHFSSKPPGEGAGDVPDILTGAYRDIGAAYYKTLATAFLGAHLRDQPDYLPYLSAAYARALSQDNPLVVDTISDLPLDQVEAAFQGRPSLTLAPSPTAPVPLRQEPILTTIQRTGELRVAMRRDAPPFGSVDNQGWTGYCPALVTALADYLDSTLESPVDIRLVALPSTLEDRFDLVRNGQVHLECGPNSVGQVAPGIQFSSLIFASGARFLTTPNNTDRVNPALSLDGLRIGVLANSTNEQLLQDRYPQAQAIRFQGPTGRTDAIAAVTTGTVDAFLGDDLLTLAEVQRTEQSIDALTLTPELPLSCEYYGLALPNDDPAWAATVNRFLADQTGEQIWADWLGSFAPSALGTLDHCLNQ